ncbi:hypothetical protein ACPXCG_17985 [Gordonia sp. DT218]|uniref:hypothetical protein n=1 Tax=unclassified Gordonia (in: high G+C Gram-positive bacteria) TaxID=2657482 RepID=UPI003CF29916
MTKFSMDISAVEGAASKVDGLAAEIRSLTLTTKMSTLGTAIPDTPNCSSPMKSVADGADATITEFVSNCGGQIEAFSALVRVAAGATERTDGFNASRFTGAGDLPTVAPSDPGNVNRPAHPR